MGAEGHKGEQMPPETVFPKVPSTQCSGPHPKTLPTTTRQENATTLRQSEKKREAGQGTVVSPPVTYKTPGQTGGHTRQLCHL